MKIKFAAVALIPFATLILLRATVHAQPPTKSIWDGVYSEAQAARGKGLSADEKRRMREQMLDVARAVPALALFAAPGGALVLLALSRVLPMKLLPSSFWDDESPEPKKELPPT